LTIIWATTGGGYYWPRWAWLAGVALLSGPVVALHARQLPAVPDRRRLGLHADVTAAVAVLLVLIWWFAGASRNWVFWPLMSVGLLLALHALVVHRHRLSSFGRARRLTERVETLTRTRAGALDAQGVELRRIERDLHDGAQARLVALYLHLGRAEARLDDDPDTAALVRAARDDAMAAISELRELARGIAPPVLVDRGLVAAVRSLVDRAPVEVSLSAHDIGRLSPVVESAAYFVVAEAVTNVAKHAPGALVQVSLDQLDGRLRLDIADDGPGGADAAGSGLAGLRARVEALDGTFAVVSPTGGPTHVHAELPCAS
jgi:signal transduction histidine kinase